MRKSLEEKIKALDDKKAELIHKSYEKEQRKLDRDLKRSYEKLQRKAAKEKNNEDR